MTTPIILIDSTSGSDTAASGAGPTTALTGTAASTDGAGTLVTLDGSPDLSGVDTTGLHVIYLADTTAGARNFGKITAADNSAKTVTVANAFGLSLTGKSWAIGGKRASAGSTTSLKLLSNNGAAGDAMAGWVVELQSGHSETITYTNFDMRRAGNVTDGAIVLRGKSGAATMPILINNQNGTFIRNLGDYQQVRDIELQNSAGTKTASIAVLASGAADVILKGLKIEHATNFFWKAIQVTSGVTAVSVDSCRVGHCANFGIDINEVTARYSRVYYCTIYSNGSHGIACSASPPEPTEICGNTVYSNGGSGIYSSRTGTTSTSPAGMAIRGNTIHGNTSDAITFTGADTQALGGTIIENNLLTSNGGWGVNFSGGPGAGVLSATGVIIRNNGFGSGGTGNTSGTISPAAASNIATGSVTADPGYANAATGDFAPSNVADQAAYLAGWIGAVQPASAGTTNYIINQIINRYVNSEEH